MFIIKKKIVVIILTLYTFCFGSEVSVSDGVVKVSSQGNCTLKINGHSHETTGSTELEGLHFGLIEYKCGIKIGWLMSKLQCSHCGLFCRHNEMIEGCESELSTFIIGGLIGGLISMVIYFLTRRKFCEFIGYIISLINYIMLLRSDKIEDKKVKKLRKRTTAVIKPIYKAPDGLNKKHYDKIVAKRESMMNLSVSNVVVLTVLFLICAVAGCDNTLYIRSDGKVCDVTGCAQLSMYELPLMSGSTVCFKDLQGDLLKFRIQSAIIRTRYSLLYYTSEYKITTEKYSRCKGAGECWNGGCYDIGMHPVLRSTKNSSVMGYGCGTDSLGCDTYCFMRTACTWWKWQLESIGDLGHVYQKISEIWEVNIKVDYKDVTTKYALNVNNPRVNLDDIMANMPIYVTGFTSETMSVPNGMIVIKGRGYETKISSLNMPETDIIGDFQISLDKQTQTYNEHMVKCTVESCGVHCNVPESKFKRFNYMIDRAHEVTINEVGNEYMVETKRQVNAIINMLVGNVDIRNLQVEKAQCAIEQIGTYSCTGCSDEPYVVIQSHNIRSEGILPFESNCTFERTFISCSPDPYKLKLTDYKKYCYIYVPSINNTIYMDFRFSFKGSLDPSKSIYSKDTEMNAIKNILTNRGFLNGLISTVSMFGMVSISASLLVRLIKIYEVKRITKDIGDV